MTSLQQRDTAAQRVAASAENSAAQSDTNNAPHDTTALLKSGAAILLVGIVTAASIPLFFGGITHQGPHTNAGWLALMVAMMCLPFGLMLFTLGAAKWIGHRRL